MKIAITTSSFAKHGDAPLALLRERGIDPVLNPYGRALTEDEAIDLLQGCVGVAAGTEPLTARLMDACPDLRVISRCGVGMDNVDQTAAAERGILVRNTPDGPTRAVAELTLGYALDLMRQVTRMDRELRGGRWQKRMGNLLQGKRVGIIGYGRIGRAVGGLFRSMGCEVGFYDPGFLPTGPGADGAGADRHGADRTVASCPGADCLGLDELLGWSDIVTLHAAKPADGSLILDAERIGRIKPGAWLINAARGGIVDEAALHQALLQGRLAGAALDVYAKEPYTGPLLDLDQVILTPHIGSYAREARVGMETDTIRNLLACLDRIDATPARD